MQRIKDKFVRQKFTHDDANFRIANFRIGEMKMSVIHFVTMCVISNNIITTTSK